MTKLIRGQRAKINPIDSSSDFTELEQRILKGTPDPNKKIKIFRDKKEEAAT